MKIINLEALRPYYVALLISFGAILSAPNAFAEKYAAISHNHTTGETVHERYADQIRHPASLTKVMTLYLLFEKIKNEDLSLSTRMRVSATAAKQPPSKIGVRKGKTISIDDAISALINKSANDVAVVIAEYVGGSQEEFAKMMTAKGRELGMTKTVYKNPHGLPNNAQVTTARDMLILAQAVLEDHPGFYDRFSERRFKWGRRTYQNTNKLLKLPLGVDGIKTGYIRASGFNLMASAKRNNERVITIILGGKDSSTRNANVEALINASFTQSNATKKNQRVFATLLDEGEDFGVMAPLVNGKPFQASDTSLQAYAALGLEPAPQSDPNQPRVALASAVLLNSTVE